MPAALQHFRVVGEGEFRRQLGDIEDALAARAFESWCPRRSRKEPSALTLIVPPFGRSAVSPALKALGSPIYAEGVDLAAGLPLEHVAADEIAAVFLDLRLRRGGAATWLCSLRSAVHQPETESRSLARSELMRSPAVGAVQRMTRGSTRGGRRRCQICCVPRSCQRPFISALARRMFQIMIGMTASMMQTAMAAPRPKSPPPRNIQSNMRLASTCVCH